MEQVNDSTSRRLYRRNHFEKSAAGGRSHHDGATWSIRFTSPHFIHRPLYLLPSILQAVFHKKRIYRS